MGRKPALTLLVLLPAILDLGSLASAARAGPRVAIVTSQSADAYAESLQGFLEHLKKNGILADIEIHELTKDREQAEAIGDRVKASAPDLVVTFGGFATEVTMGRIDDIPIVAGMVLHPEPLGAVPNVAGVTLELPARIHFEWVRRFLPETRVIGVIYNSEENESRVALAREEAERMGLKLEAVQVSSPRNLPGALDAIARRADVLWGIPDRIAMTTETAKQVMLFCLRNRIPFVGLSAAWAKAGALYSLDGDYQDIGVQCGELSVRVLTGEPIDSLPILSPRRVRYSVNLKTFEHLRLKITDQLIEGAEAAF